MAFVARLNGWTILGSTVGYRWRGGEANIVPLHLYLFSDALVFAVPSFWHGSRPPKKLRALNDIAPQKLTPNDITDRDAKALTIPVDQIVAVRIKKNRFWGRALPGGTFSVVFKLADDARSVAMTVRGKALDTNVSALSPILGARLELDR